MENDEKIGILGIIAIVFTILVVGLAAYFMFFHGDRTKKVYKVDECVKIEKNGDIQTISFLNSSSIYDSYLEKQNEAISNVELEKREIKSEIYGNVLSIITIEKYKEEEKGYSLNVNLDRGRVVSTYDMMRKFKVEIKDVYTKILNEIFETIDKDTMKQYLEKLEYAYSSFDVFVNEGNLYAVFVPNNIAKRLEVELLNDNKNEVKMIKI